MPYCGPHLLRDPRTVCPRGLAGGVGRWSVIRPQGPPAFGEQRRRPEPSTAEGAHGAHGGASGHVLGCLDVRAASPRSFLRGLPQDSRVYFLIMLCASAVGGAGFRLVSSLVVLFPPTRKGTALALSQDWAPHWSGRAPPVSAPQHCAWTLLSMDSTTLKAPRKPLWLHNLDTHLCGFGA